jgi:hypothetical protein
VEIIGERFYDHVADRVLNGGRVVTFETRLACFSEQEGQRAERIVFCLFWECFSMDNRAEFQMVCGVCGSLQIKIENPETASREAIVYWGRCGIFRGTVGALRDLASRPDAQNMIPRVSKLPPLNGRPQKPRFPSEILEQFRELQSFRRKVESTESLEQTLPNILHSSSDPRKIN